jgi:hypothetical protein
MKYGEKVMKKIVLVCAALMIVLGGLIVQVKQPISVVQAQSGLPPAANQVQGTQGTSVVAGQVQMTLLSQPPVLTAERRKQLDAQSIEPAAMPTLAEGTTAVQRPDSGVGPSKQIAPPPAAAVNITPPGSFTIFRDTILSHFDWYVSRVAEPTVVNSGPYVFMTANWMAAVSQDGGQTFKYIDPYTQFPASYGGFCCDQVAVYDPARDIFIWYLQYLPSETAGIANNIFRIAVAHPADAVKGLWFFYDFISTSNTWWDYPDLAVSNDYLWVTTNRVPYGASYVDDAWIFKLPLDELSVGSGFSYFYQDLSGSGLSNYSLRMTRGARETMYFGSHNTTSQVRIFYWPETSVSTLYYNDVNLSAPWYTGYHDCTSPDGYNLCGFDDGRIKAGWVSNGKVGFMWGSSQGGAFPYPYIEGVRVNESGLTYLDRPIEAAAWGGFAYPAVAPNARGDLGLAAFVSGGGYYPWYILGIDDDYARDAGASLLGSWEFTYMRSGYGPIANRWGDYISVQQFNPNGLAWVAGGFMLQGGNTNGNAEPSYTIFGRQRDLHSAALYMDPRFATFIPILSTP